MGSFCELFTRASCAMGLLLSLVATVGVASEPLAYVGFDAATQSPAARDGLGLAESLRHAYLIAGLSSNAGEACCKLGRWDEAEPAAGRTPKWK